jgi:DNA-binding response OmpR family regulator
MSRILAVEDDTDLRYIYEMILSRQGHEVVLAENTVKAILYLTNEDFDLIILDMNMPDMPGTKLVEFARDDARLKNIPIIVVSASETWKDQVIGRGVTHFLVKPVAMHELAAMIERVLGE